MKQLLQLILLNLQKRKVTKFNVFHVDKQIFALTEEIVLLKERSADVENENKKLLEEKNEILIQQEKMHVC